MDKGIRLKILDIEERQLNRYLRENNDWMGIPTAPYTLRHTQLDSIRTKLTND